MDLKYPAEIRAARQPVVNSLNSRGYRSVTNWLVTAVYSIKKLVRKPFSSHPGQEA